MRKWFRDVNRGLLCQGFSGAQGIGYPVNRDRVIRKALVCGAARRTENEALFGNCFFRREGGDDFFEAGIAAQGVPERHQF